MQEEVFLPMSPLELSRSKTTCSLPLCKKAIIIPRPALVLPKSRRRWWLPLRKNMILIPRPTLAAFVAEERVMCPERFSREAQEQLARGGWSCDIVLSMKDYLDIEPISKPITPAKQAARRHYGSHPYFTKRAWNVVGDYIKNFTDQGDLVLDPFGGAGITAVESLVHRRRAVHIDSAPLANFITEQVAVSPVDLQEFSDHFYGISADCRQRILDLYDMTNEEIEACEIPAWYPAGVPLPSNSDVATVEECFHRRSLIGLSILLERINAIPDATIRDLFRLVFAATLVKTNLTFSSTTGRLESRGDSGIFRVYRYWVPKRTVELNVWEQFCHRYTGVKAAKKETNQHIGDFYRPGETIQIIHGSATEIEKYVPRESVDYIFTDPPYGAHIAYLDLLTMWHAWLQMEVTARDRELEVIEGGELHKTKEDYSHLLEQSLDQMFGALKADRWLSIVFSHKDPAYWDAIVSGAQRAGFEYVNTAVQKAYQPSLHKRKNPLRVLSGELILNFRKVTNPRTIAISYLGSDVVQLMKNVAELEIVRNHGASTEDIYNGLIPALLEHGLLGEVRKRFADITPLLDQEFDFREGDGRWHIRPTNRLGSFVPVKERIAFYVIDYLKKAQRLGQNVTFDDVIQNVMPNLVNGVDLTNQSIQKVLEQVAYSPDGTHWELGARPGEVRQLDLGFKDAVLEIPLLPIEEEISHSGIIYRLAKLGMAAGLLIHVGQKEQSEAFMGEKLSGLSLRDLPEGGGLNDWARSKIQQIDCIWYSTRGDPVFAFEVESTTAITTGIDRFLELLGMAPSLAGRVVLMAPNQRENELNKILRNSHYVGHPLYMENKLSYIFLREFLRIYDSLVGTKPNADALVQRFVQAVVRPRLAS